MKIKHKEDLSKMIGNLDFKCIRLKTKNQLKMAEMPLFYVSIHSHSKSNKITL